MGTPDTRNAINQRQCEVGVGDDVLDRKVMAHKCPCQANVGHDHEQKLRLRSGSRDTCPCGQTGQFQESLSQPPGSSGQSQSLLRCFYCLMRFRLLRVIYLVRFRKFHRLRDFRRHVCFVVFSKYFFRNKTSIGVDAPVSDNTLTFAEQIRQDATVLYRYGVNRISELETDIDAFPLYARCRRSPCVVFVVVSLNYR